MKKIWKFMWMVVPVLALLVGGGYLLGLEQAKTILGWVFLISGAVGLVGLIYTLLKK